MISRHRTGWSVFLVGLFCAWFSSLQNLPAQTIEKMRRGYSGTGINNYCCRQESEV
jgi:hypothetical protein